jgi:trans-AT polyketide synthase, acyltransferase and oxidoreductase domains
MRAVLFQGQGSQRPGMGGKLFTRHSDMARRADAALGFSVEEVCRGDDGRLNLTQFAQPAIYVVSILAYLDARSKMPPPDFVAGHSIGEYAALTIAQVCDFEIGLALVKKRGELMGAADGGGLAAIIGADHLEIEALVAACGAPGLEFASFNTPRQTIVGGPKPSLGALIATAAKQNIRVVPLQVSGAFHTSQMRVASEAFRAFVADFRLGTPVIPVTCNLTGDLHRSGGDIGDVLARHIAEPVRWRECVETLIALGADDFGDPRQPLSPNTRGPAGGDLRSSRPCSRFGFGLDRSPR